MSYPYPARRPGAPKVMGVLAIIFGGLTVLMSGLGLLAEGGTLAGIAGEGVSRDQLAGLDEALAADVRILDAVGVAQNLMFVLMSFALVAIGVGSVQYRRWAAKAARIWSTLALVLLGVLIVVMLTVLVEPMQNLMEFAMEQQDEEAPRGLAMGILGVLALIVAALYAPFPIIMAVQYRKQRNIDAMTE